MKKILFLLLFITGFLQAQTLQNPTYGNTTTNTLKIKTPVTVTSVSFLSTNEADGSVNKIAPINITIPYTPVNYSISNQSIGQHLTGIDTRLGQISSTSAGITQRVYFTADNTTVTAGTFFTSSITGKGTAASGSPSALVLGDNTKGYFNKDVISVAQPSATIGYAGTYSGILTVSATPTPVATQQRFTVEIYRTNNGGTPIASGVSGAPTGDLGVTVLAILDSGVINLAAGSITNVPVNGILTQNVTINTGERLRYHVSAAKIGTGGGNVTFGVYYGTSYNSYYDVPVAITTDAVLNKSLVSGVTATDALNTLRSTKSDKLQKVFYLSQQGCISDADLSLGSTTFGTNNTAAIQAVLNVASDGTQIKVIVDGKYSTNLLTIYSNTTIEASSQGNGFILRSGSNSPMFINSNIQDTGTIVNQNIRFVGGTYNFNGTNQVHDNSTYGFICGMNMVGVKNMWVEDVIFYAPATFTLWFINWENIHISGCRVDVGAVVDNSDGFHFNGKGNGAYVENNYFRTKDDAIAINADDALPNTLPYQTHGDISNVFLKNNTLVDCRFGIRVLSGASKITNITIDGLFGQTAIYAIIVDNFWQQHATYTQLDGPGNIDNLTIRNIKTKVTPLAIGSAVYKSTINISVIVRNLIIDDIERQYSGYTDAPIITIAQPDTVIENALITNVYDWTSGDNTVIPSVYIESATIRKLTLSNIYKKRASLVDSPVLDLFSGSVNNVIFDNIRVDNIQSIAKLRAGSSVNSLKMVNVSALNKTNAYPLILNNITLPILESKNSYDSNLWSGSGTITKVWADNNFPESVYGVTEATVTNDTRLASTAFVKNVDATSVKNSGAQRIGSSTSSDAVLTLREDATLSTALSLRNRNATLNWGISVDEASVDDGNFAIINKTSNQVRFSITPTGVVKIPNISGIGTRFVVADANGNLSAISTDTRPYKVYVALLTQSGTSAPIATVLENTLGGSVVWARTGVGTFTATLSNAFTSGKTFLIQTPSNGLSNNTKISSVWTSTSIIQYDSKDGANVLSDGIIFGAAGTNGASIEIRVYN